MTSTTLLAVLKAVIFPPGGLISALLVAWLVSRWLPRTGLGIAIAACLSFVLLCLPSVSLLLSAPVERVAPAASSSYTQAGAIVVLGGGRAVVTNPSINGGQSDRVNLDTLGRVAEGARIARLSNLPLLMTGGHPGGEARSEAALMEDSLNTNFHLKARWLEGESRNTRENAIYSAAILRQHRIDTIILVTTAFHMARAQRDFERQGLKVIPAPIGFSSGPGGLLNWLPSTLGLAQSQRALHEMVGWLAGR